MVYLLDANVFIQAKNQHYGMDFCPGFWDWLLASNAAGTVASVSEVATELQAGADQLAQWSAKRGAEFFLEPDTSVVLAVGRIGQWVASQPFKAAAVHKFIGGADHILIAHALAKQLTVVSHEKRSNSLNAVKIPDVCDKFQIECISPFEMLRREKARLILGETV